MAIEHTPASAHSTATAHSTAAAQGGQHPTAHAAKATPAKPTSAKPVTIDWRMPSDRFQASEPAPTRDAAPAHEPAPTHEPAPAHASEEATEPKQSGSKLAGLANLGRLQHGLHLLAPIGNLAKGAGKASRVAGALDAAQVASHAGHGLDVAKAPGALGAAKIASHAGHGLDMAKGVSGGFLARLGGPLSAFATGLSAVVAVLDIKRAVGVLNDPKATSKEKTLTTTQAALSGASGAAGLLAAAGALGLALPFGIPALLTVSTVTGLASFVVSLFNRKSSHKGHS